jgi:hypothetical protein
MTIDVTKTIIPKSDQLNADDLIAGPMTFRIRDVKPVRDEQQPLHIFLEGEDRPWKPALTSRRVLISIWGVDAEKWIGMSLTLFCDPTVKWAGKEVGGIRISHMEGISQPRVLKLTTTRGKRAPTTIQPLKNKRESAADKIRARLFEIAESGEMNVDDAWSKLKPEQREALGDDLLYKLKAIQGAAEEHRANDPDAAANALNESLGN